MKTLNESSDWGGSGRWGKESGDQSSTTLQVDDYYSPLSAHIKAQGESKVKKEEMAYKIIGFPTKITQIKCEFVPSELCADSSINALIYIRNISFLVDSFKC